MKMGKGKIAVLAALTAAVILTIVTIVSNQPLVRTPDGGVPVNNELDTAAVERFVADEAGVPSDRTERIIAVYNANWQELSGRVMAVVTVKSDASEEMAHAWAEALVLGENDALLLMGTEGAGKCVMVSYGSFREDLDAQPGGFVDSLTYRELKSGNYDAAVENVFARSHLFLGDYHEAVAESGIRIGLVIAVVLGLIVACLIVLKIVDIRRAIADRGAGNETAGGTRNHRSRGMEGAPVYRKGGFLRQKGGYNGGFGSSHNSNLFGGENGGFGNKK